MKTAVRSPALAALALTLWTSASVAQQSICETVQKPIYDANGRVAGSRDVQLCPGIISPDICDSGGGSPRYDIYGRWQGYNCN